MEPKDITRAFYNSLADHSFSGWFENETLLPVLTPFISCLPKNPQVLDLGCGTGGESRRMADLGARVTGIDFSEESLAFARTNVPQAEFLLMDINSLNFNPETFHGVVEAGGLFHFTSEEQDGILGKIRAILKKGGRFLSFYPEGNFEGVQELFIDGKPLKRYVRRIPHAVWREQAAAAGLRFVKTYPFYTGDFVCAEFEKE